MALRWCGSTASGIRTAGGCSRIYVAAYTAGRAVVEALRDDHANRFLGLRLNDWVSLIVFLGALTVLWIRRDRRTGTGQDRGQT